MRAATSLEAADGASALQMPARRHVDLVLLDLHMPRVHGLDVLRAVQTGGTSSQIALMSAAASVEDAVEARRLGISRRALYRLIDKYAAKPGGA